MRIAYLLDCFPKLSETFVTNEVLALRRRGETVRVYSLRRPDARLLTPNYRALAEETVYVDRAPLPRRVVLRAAAYWLARSPARFLRAIRRTRRVGDARFRARFRRALFLARRLNEARIDHIHTHFAAEASEWALLVSWISGIPWSVTPHAYELFSRPRLLAPKLRGASAVVAVSRFHKRYIQSLCADGPTPTPHVVHYGIDCARFQPPPYSARPERARPRILGIGRLVEKKGFSFLVHACHRLVEAGTDLECWIAGDGPLEKALSELAQAGPARDRIQLLGAVDHDEVLRLMHQSDLFVLPCVQAPDGDMDGIPNVLMEAMACGLPVISTTLSGIPELIDPDCGRLVEPEDENALAMALAELLKLSSEERRFLGVRGREVVKERFNLDRQVDELRRVFAAVGARASE